MTKKPAVLSDRLLAHRPRKGEAKPQTETQASAPVAESTQSVTRPAEAQSTSRPAPGRRRKRRSEKTQQLNLRVSEETLEHFTQLADRKNVIFGDLLALLLEEYEKR